MKSRTTIVVAVTLILAARLCSAAGGQTSAAPRLVEKGWKYGVKQESVVPDYMGDNLEMAVIPTPKQAALSGKMLGADGAVLVVPDEYPHGNTIESITSGITVTGVVEASEWKDDPAVQLVISLGNPSVNPVTARLAKSLRIDKALAGNDAAGADIEGYRLLVTGVSKKRSVAIIAGNGPAGDFWGAQSLRQLFAEKDGKLYISGTWIVDWPSYRYRGSKASRQYLPQYKDNFSWGRGSKALKANFGYHIAYASPPGQLDCSDVALDKYEKGMIRALEAGSSGYGFKFDDVIVGMTPEAAARFKTYGKAIVYFITEMDKRAKRFNPQSKVYYLPQCYYSSSFYPTFSKAIRDAGGFPRDVGLVWTGTHVFSPTLPVEEIKAYLEAFGCTQTKGLIYDNFMREGDNVPIRGRGADLLPYLDGVFSERSTRYNRLTRCDYNWNPEAYDAERAMKLACRETAGGRPDVYQAIYEIIACYDANRTMPPTLNRAEKLAKMKAANAQLTKLRAQFQEAVSPDEAPEVNIARAVKHSLYRSPRGTKGSPEVKIMKDFANVVAIREKKEAKLLAAGYREIVAARAAGTVTLDAQLDEECWKTAAVMKDFVTWDQEKWTKLGETTGAPAPKGQPTVVKITYDDSNLYIGAVCKSDVPIPDAICCSLHKRANAKYNKVKIWWPTVDKTKRDVYGVWHSPCIEFFIAPGTDRMNFYHMIANSSDLTYDAYSGQPSDMWNPDWKTVSRMNQEGTEWTTELSIPFSAFGVKPPKPGETWGLNMCRAWPGHQMWSFVWSPKGYHTPEDFGTLTFR